MVRAFSAIFVTVAAFSTFIPSLAIVPGMRYVRDVSPSALRREVPVELEAREPFVILPGMDVNIDTRLPWNKNGPRFLFLKRKFAEELQESGLLPLERQSDEKPKKLVRRSPFSIYPQA